MKNILFVIEGTDGSGKQTQTKLLAEKLNKKNFNVVTQSFPNYESQSSAPVKMYLNGDFGENANSLNAYQASSLYAVDRLCTMKILRQKLNKKDILIFDRYVESNLIHQACKINNMEEREKFINWLLSYEYEVLNLPKPKLVFFLNMPPKQSIQLAHAREELKAGTSKDIHEKDKNYLMQAYNTGIEVARIQGWTIIDCVNQNGEIKSPEQINDEIYVHIEQVLKQAIIEECFQNF